MHSEAMMSEQHIGQSLLGGYGSYVQQRGIDDDADDDGREVGAWTTMCDGMVT